MLTVLKKKQCVAGKGTGKPQSAELEFSNTSLCAHTNLKQIKRILDCFISVINVGKASALQSSYEIKISRRGL